MFFSQALTKNLFLDIFYEIIYFPVWWYSSGLKKTAFFCFRNIRVGWRALSLAILLANLFKSMYATHGLDAYILSLGVRIFQISWRVLVMIVYSLFWLAILMSWLILLPLALWMIAG